MEKVTGYKGFNKDLQCRNFQYEIGKTYHQDGMIKCHCNGFHLCEEPIEVLAYYAPNFSRYCNVVGYGDCGMSDMLDDIYVFSNIEIKKEITLEEFISCCVQSIKDTNDNFINVDLYGTTEQSCYTFSHILMHGISCTSVANGCNSLAETMGHHSVAVSNLMSSISYAHGNRSVAVTNYNYSISICSGQHSVAIANNENSIAYSKECNSVAITTETKSISICEEKQSIAIATGTQSVAKIKNEDSIAISTHHGFVSGVIGSWLILIERDENEHIIDIKSVKVDGIKIKENTNYHLVKGKIVEYK